MAYSKYLEQSEFQKGYNKWWWDINQLNVCARGA